MDLFAQVRRDWLLLLITFVAPIAAVYFFLPAEPVGPEELEHPEWRFRGAEVHFDRVEPLPWSFHDHGGTVHTRFALGWIGERALLIQTKPTMPSGTTLHGDLKRLTGEPKKWVAQTPALAGVAYDAVLDLTTSVKGAMAGVMAILCALGALVGWLWRFLAPMARPITGAEPLPIDLATLPPRTDEVAAEIGRRHAPSDRFAVGVAIYTSLVLELPFLIVAIAGEPTFWEGSSTLRMFGTYGLGFAVGAPVSISLFVWWARRRRAAFEHVARDGAVVTGVIDDADVGLARGRARHTVFDIHVAGERGGQHYRGSVRGLRDWARRGTPVRVLALDTERLAIAIAPTGEGFATRRSVNRFGV